MRHQRGRGVWAIVMAVMAWAACGHALVGDTLLHLSFDDTITMHDSSHHANHGLFKGLPAGQTGTCMYFSGTHTYIEIPDAPAMELGFADFTLEAWVKPTSLTSAMTLLSKGSSWRLLINSGGTVTFEYTPAGGSLQTLSTTATVSANAWNQIEVERSGGVLRILLGGTQEATGTISGNIADTTAKLFVSVKDAGGGTFTDRLVGYLDEIKLFRPIAIDKKCIMSADYNTYAIKQDGSMWVWGLDLYAGKGTETSDILLPQKMTGIWPYTIWEKVVMSHSTGRLGLRSNVFGTNNTVFGWGENADGALGMNGIGSVIGIPTSIYNENSMERYYNIFGGLWCAYGISQNGLFSWGAEPTYIYLLGDGTSSVRGIPALIDPMNGYDLEVMATLGAIVGDLGHTEPLTVWGSNYYGIFGSLAPSSSSVPVVSTLTENWKDLCLGSFQACGIKEDGSLWGWGYGPLGDGATTFEVYHNPVQIGSDTDWVWVTMELGGGGNGGPAATYAIKSDGTLWGWGVNNYCRLGISGVSDGERVYQPTQVGTDTNWVAVFAGLYNTFGLKKAPDGGLSLWAWGLNTHYSLGLGIMDNTVATPTQVGTDTDWGLPVSKFIGFDTLTNLSPAAGTTVTTTPTFSWDAKSDATRYELFVYSEDPQQELLHVREYANSSYTVTEALPGANAKWTVRAGNGRGWYEWASPISIIIGDGGSTGSTGTTGTTGSAGATTMTIDSFIGVSGCTIDAGAAKSALYSTDFTTLDGWTVGGTPTHGSISATAGGAVVTCETNGSNDIYNLYLSRQAPSVDYDVVLTCDYNTVNINDGDVQRWGLKHYSSDLYFVMITVGTTAADISSYACRKNGGLIYTSFEPLTWVTGQMRLKREGIVYTRYVRETSADAWTLVRSDTVSYGGTQYIRAFAYDGTVPDGTIFRFSNFEALDGIWVDDAVASTGTLDAGNGCAFDWSTLVTTLNPGATGTLEVRESDDGTTWGAWGSVPAANTGKQYAEVRVTFGNGDSTQATLSSLTIDTYVK